MQVEHHPPTATVGSPSAAVSVARRHLRAYSIQDWLVLAYLIVLNIAALTAQPGPERVRSIEQMFGLLLFSVIILVLVRGGLLHHGFFAPLFYRLAIWGTVQISYFFLAGLLPILGSRRCDAALHQVDQAWFGGEPAMAMERFVTPFVTEWFAFFYFSYFILLAVHFLPILFGCRHHRRLGEFTLGMLLVFCIGHVGYMLVPGYGPYREFADQFAGPLPNGRWMDLVMATVTSGGSQLDIFPSLHTAAPTMLTLFAFRHRHQRPYRYTWAPLGLFTANIIIATMYLRWHYVIDVVAGLLLAGFAVGVSAHLTDRELKRRQAQGLGPIWPLFFGTTPRSRTPARR